MAIALLKQTVDITAFDLGYMPFAVSRAVIAERINNGASKVFISSHS